MGTKLGTKQIFEKKCFDLLSLMRKGDINNIEDITLGGKIFRHDDKDTFLCFSNYDYDKNLEALIEVLLDVKEWRENISHKYLKSKIESFLLDCFFIKKGERSKHINNFYKNIKKELKNLNEFTVPILIEQLSFNTDTFVGDVNFISYSPENCTKICQIIENDPLNKIPKVYQVNTKETEIDARTRYIKSIAVVKVTSLDFLRAIEKADEKVEEALNVIRLFYRYSSFGIFGKHSIPFQENIAIDADGIISTYSGWNGDIVGCNFNTDDFSYDSQISFKNICTMLRANQKNELNKKEEMKKKLLTAINIFGDIQKSRDTKHNISKIFTALETLLIFDREWKGENIAIRTVLINHDKKEIRVQKHKVISKMYDCRNDLVHKGSTDFKISDYETLLTELQFCILIIAEYIDKYPTKNDWKNKIGEANNNFEANLIF